VTLLSRGAASGCAWDCTDLSLNLMALAVADMMAAAAEAASPSQADAVPQAGAVLI
jgi:hypothetical protein